MVPEKGREVKGHEPSSPGPRPVSYAAIGNRAPSAGGNAGCTGLLAIAPVKYWRENVKSLLAMIALACGSVAYAEVVLHVSPSGNDAAPGTPRAPFATVERARDAVRALKRDGRPLSQPVTVLLADGVYRLERPLVFAPADSGTAEAPVTYAAEPGAKPILSGGKLIDGWRRTDDRLWGANVPWATARAEPLTQLFVNGQRRLRAHCEESIVDHVLQDERRASVIDLF